MKNFLKKRWYIILGLILILGFVGYRVVSANTSSQKISSYTVSRQDLKETISFSGEIKADEDVTLRFQASGRLAWVGVKVGDQVKKYQTIASLDQREVKKNLEKYLNAYMDDRWDLEQARDDYKNQVLDDAAKRVIDKAQFAVNSAVLDVELKDLAIEFSNLWTPISGLVVKADSPQAGVNITPTQAEFEVINPNSVYFAATADQNDVVNLTSSQSGEIILDPYPDQTIASSISNIAFTPKSGETGTVYEMKMTLPINNSNYKFRLGMTGDVTFTIKEATQILAIPDKFIKTNTDGSKYVWLKVNGNRMKKTITVGTAFDEGTEITSGLNEGDIIFEN